MIVRPASRNLGRFLTVPALAVVCWLFLQKTCAPIPDLSTAGTLADAGTTASQPVVAAVGQEADALPRSSFTNSVAIGGVDAPQSRSLRQASDLLRRAATMLDKNDRSAIRLILQAITILKHEVMRGSDFPEYDHVAGERLPSPGKAPVREALSPSFTLSSSGLRFGPGVPLVIVRLPRGDSTIPNNGWVLDHTE